MKTLIFCIVFLCAALQIIAQDATFSQFYHAPTMFNPAEIGHRTDGQTYRINGVHRSLGEGFKTTSLSFDGMSEWQDRSATGLGLTFVHDQTPSGGFRTTTLIGGFAFHVSLDANEKHYLSVGTQFGTVNNQIRTDKLNFENDILGGESETFMTTNLFNMDSRLGMIYTFFPNEEVQLTVGFGINHFVNFNNRFIDSYSQTDGQYTTHLVYTQHLGNWTINPHILYSEQGTFRQGLIGCTAAFTFNNEKGLLFGASYRTSDLSSFNKLNSKNVIIAIIGITFKDDSRFYASFDGNISPLNNNNNMAGNLELGFQYLINSHKSKRKVNPVELHNQGH